MKLRAKQRNRVALGIVLLWFLIVVSAGVYAGNHGVHSILGGLGGLIAVGVLAISLRGWQHLLALPLYLFFGLEAWMSLDHWMWIWRSWVSLLQTMGLTG